jgi:peptidoglycan/xylan/chitin deacetylase (PgdA/CDA1 family)
MRSSRQQEARFRHPLFGSATARSGAVAAWQRRAHGDHGSTADGTTSGIGYATCAYPRTGGLSKFEQARVEAGNHTASHVHSRAVSRAEIDREIVGAKKELESLAGEKCSSLGDHLRSLPATRLQRSYQPRGKQVTKAIFLVQARSINVFSKSPTLWYRGSIRFENDLWAGDSRRLLPWLRTQ